MKHEKVIESAEHVLPGHPDKLCDAAVDGIVEALRQMDPRAQCGLEMSCVFDQVYLTGRIAADEKTIGNFNINGGCNKYIRNAYYNAGYGKNRHGIEWEPRPDKLKIRDSLCVAAFSEEESDLRSLSDDQAVCIGYANMLEETNHMPPAVWLARKIARYLCLENHRTNVGSGPDGKVLVRIERRGSRWKPLHVSISQSHLQDCDWLKLRQHTEGVVEEACSGLGTPRLSLNAGGMFVSVGPNGDNGLSGKKLVVDAYGPTVPIGGGAWSGKDLHKVDRLGGLLARRLAKQIIRQGLAGEATVMLEYHPGCEEPVQALARLDGRKQSIPIEKLLKGACIDNETVWYDFSQDSYPLHFLACWGHQEPGLPWEH